MRRNKGLIISISVGIVCVIIAIILTAVITNKRVTKKKDAEIIQIKTELEASKQQIATATRNVYVAISDIKCGDTITLDKLQQQSVLSSVPQDYFITEDAVGKVAKLNIPASVPILSCMTTDEVKTGVSEVEVSYLNLNTNLAENDFVDIRIKFPNGEDYIVAAKKNVKYLNLAAANCFFWLNEEELLSLSGAAVDATVNGARLYVTKYVEPSTQAANIVTYQPSLDVIRLMASDPNIVNIAKRKLSAEARVNLEARLKLFQKSQEKKDGDPGVVIDASGTNTKPGSSDGVSTTEATTQATTATTETTENTGSEETNSEY